MRGPSDAKRCPSITNLKWDNVIFYGTKTSFFQQKKYRKFKYCFEQFFSRRLFFSASVHGGRSACFSLRPSLGGNVTGQMLCWEVKTGLNSRARRNLLVILRLKEGSHRKIYGLVGEPSLEFRMIVFI